MLARSSPPPPARWLLLVLLPLLLFGGRSARGDESEIDRRKRELILKLKVNRAIDRGVVWLATQQRRDGSFHLKGDNNLGPFPTSRHEFGETALVTLTLAHGGFGPDKPEIKKAVAYLKKRYRSQMKGDYWTQASAYSLSILVLALHELYAQEPTDEGDADRARYGDAIRRRKNPCRYPTWARKTIESILDWLLETRSDRGLFRYPGGLEESGRTPPPGGPPPGRRAGGPGGPAGGMPSDDFLGPEDLSNSQYVLLALWAGTRCGYEVDRDVLVAIARRLLAVQERNGPPVTRVPDPPSPEERGGSRYGFTPTPTSPSAVKDRARGFGYTPGEPPTGSMTTAGLASLAIIKAILRETRGLEAGLARELDQGIWDGIAWLTLHYTVAGNPMSMPGGRTTPEPIWHYYYLYGLERAGVILAKRFLGDHDWYQEGAQLLVDAQQEKGPWKPRSAVGGWAGPGSGPVYDTSMLDTCFAILFLKRAAMEPKQPLLPGPVVTPR